MKLIASAVFFIVMIGLVFWRERRRWKKFNVRQQAIEAEIPKLMQHATERYQAKYGRAPSVLEDLPPQLVANAKR